MQLINSRIISLSYPWIGVPMEMYRANQQSSVPFVLAHITRVVIYYSVYEVPLSRPLSRPLSSPYLAPD